MIRKIFGAACVAALLSAPAMAAVTGVDNVDLSAGAYTFAPTAGVSFTLSYDPMPGFDTDPVLIQTTGSAEVSSFGGFLGIPLQPSTFFTSANITVGPGLFTQWASYSTPTEIPFSITPSDLALRYMVGGDTFYGYARFAGPDLVSLGFETMANTPITAGDTIGSAVPEPATWAMMLIGFAGLAFVGRRRTSRGNAFSSANA